MKVVQLNRYNLPEVEKNISQCEQLLPFYYSQKKSRDALVVEIGKSVYNVYGLEKNNELVAYISLQENGTGLIVKNYLLMSEQLTTKQGQFFWLNYLEKIAKKLHKQEVKISFSILNQDLQSKLIALGYTQSSEAGIQQIFCKKMVYRTALVLAGGGARGAYQIGVWQALSELKIPFDLITGTSVGALNGALIAQGDKEVAQKMWREIDTGQILSYEGLTLNSQFTMQETIQDIQKLVISAMNHQGVSTAPLANLIERLLDEDIMYQQPKELYLCTTQLPQLKETIISLKEVSPKEFPKWLLASASFFPAMAATEINGAYYVDGGYRNNIPIDVALKAGATEVIVVDVKGPGVTKAIKVPHDVALRELTSSWSLGSVLLFDGARSDFNIQLGYLETLKSYGKYLGHWYTFSHKITDDELVEWQQLFNEYVLTIAEQVALKKMDEKELNAMIVKVRNLYNDRLTIENLGLFVLEYVAKLFNVSPVNIYTIPELIQHIQDNIHDGWEKDDNSEESMMLSLNEWLRRYVNGTVFLSDKQQVASMCHLLKSEGDVALLKRIWPVAPQVFLAARLINYLEKERNEGNEPRI